MSGMDYFTAGATAICVVAWGIVLIVAHWNGGER